MRFFGGFAFFFYLCTMIEFQTSNFVLSNRELFLVIIASVIYVVLFVVTILNSRRKILQLRERINKVHVLKEEQEAQSEQSIEANRKKIAELENLLKKLGDENSMLKLELEERKAKLDYANTLAIIDNEKRQQAESVIFGSDIYAKIKDLIDRGQTMGKDDWKRLTELVDSIYSGFTGKLYSLYRMNEHDYHVSLLIKIHLQPKEIATLTAHSKESVSSTRSRLYQKIFGQKASPKEWDDFILSL
jgi:regulator of replication initiation timing